MTAPPDNGLSRTWATTDEAPGTVTGGLARHDFDQADAC
jgi:hypothetical protein